VRGLIGNMFFECEFMSLSFGNKSAEILSKISEKWRKYFKIKEKCFERVFYTGTYFCTKIRKNIGKMRNECLYTYILGAIILIIQTFWSWNKKMNINEIIPIH